MSENTTIIVSKDTRQALKDIGRMGETYDDLIRRLMREKEVAEKYIYDSAVWENYQKELEAEG